MKFLALLTLAATGTALAKGHRNGTEGTSTKSQCKQVQQLTQLVDLAANATRLDSKTKGNATRADAIKAKASEAATTLQAMQANATLMDACGQIFAVQAMEKSCAKMASLEKLQELAANATKLDAKFEGNATKIAAVQAKASAGAGKLTAMAGNATLTQFCAAARVEAQCSAMSKMQKEVDRAANATALSAKFDGDASKIEKAQAQASKAATKLEAMKSNSTLVGLCGAQANTKTNNAAAASSSSPASEKSGASDVAPYAMAHIVSLVAVLATGIFLI